MNNVKMAIATAQKRSNGAVLGGVYTGPVGTVPYGTDWNCLELVPL